jgi:hypothetical protein
MGAITTTIMRHREYRLCGNRGHGPLLQDAAHKKRAANGRPSRFAVVVLL